MRRVRYHAHGGPEVLALEDAGIPEPGPGQVLLRTEAIGVNWLLEDRAVTGRLVLVP